MTESWLPDDKAYAILERNQIPRKYAGTLIKDFIDYWIVENIKRASWQQTFINRVKSQWEYARHNRFKDYDKSDQHCTNLFESTLDKLQRPNTPQIPDKHIPAPKPARIPSKTLTKGERIAILNKHLPGLTL
jgi:hypothetical protein